MQLPHLGPSPAHVELGGLCLGAPEEPNYLAPTAMGGNGPDYYPAAVYGFAMQQALQGLESGLMEGMSDEQYRVAKWMRDYLMDYAERVARGLGVTYGHLPGD